MSSYLKKYLKQKIVISDEELENILICFHSQKANKNEVLIQQNKICKQLFFIKKGCLRVVCTREDGQEWTRQIAIENEFITIFPSFLEQTISDSYLQTVEASEVFYTSHENFKKLNSIIPNWERLYTSILEQSYVNSIKRIEKLIVMNGKNLFEDFKLNNPDLFKRLPNKILASYLGISQETLSRLKTKK